MTLLSRPIFDTEAKQQTHLNNDNEKTNKQTNNKRKKKKKKQKERKKERIYLISPKGTLSTKITPIKTQTCISYYTHI